MRTNVRFWHWYAHLITEGLTDEHLRWQPADHANNIAFTLFHPFRSEDGVVARQAGRPTVYESGGWSKRLPLPDGVESVGALNRAQIAALAFRRDDLLDYVDVMRDSLLAYLDDLGEEQATEEIELPGFQRSYPGFGRMSRLDLLAFMAIGHVCEHLGEVQYIKGLMGLRGAPM